MATKTPHLLWNEEDNYHAQTIIDDLNGAREFICVVAFAKSSGFRHLKSALKARLSKGMKAIFIVGTHFFQSDPDLLDELIALRPRENVKVYMGDFENHALSTFHPKLYLFDHGRKTSLIVGSANLTGGGLSDNYELSIRVAGQHQDLAEEVRGWVKLILKRREVVPATKPLIERYRRAFEINKLQMRLARQKTKKAIESPKGGLWTFRNALADLRADPGPEGFDALVVKRTSDRTRGLELLKILGAPGKTTRSEFESLYGSLIKTMHSGGLPRYKSRIANAHEDFQSAVRRLLDLNSSTQEMFDEFCAGLEEVLGAGINVISEVLHLMDNRRYAVMNQNSVSGIALCGYDGYPKNPLRTSVDGELYSRFCDHANEVRKDLGLSSLSELDVLFNYVYWQNKS